MNELDEVLVKTVLGEPQVWKAVVNYGTADSSVAIHMDKMSKGDSFEPCAYYWESEPGKDWELMFGFIAFYGNESEKSIRRRLNRYCLRKLRTVKAMIKYLRAQGCDIEEIRTRLRLIVQPEIANLEGAKDD